MSRADTIKYAANVISGVHSSAPRERSDHVLSSLRRRFRYKIDGQQFQIVGTIARDAEDPPLIYDPTAVDPVLVEIYAAGQYILKSEDTAKLETVIKTELGV